MKGKSVCTWKHCKKIAIHSQVNKNKKEWSNLCNEHHNELEKSISSLDPKTVLRAWVLASGGAKKLAGDIFK